MNIAKLPELVRIAKLRGCYASQERRLIFRLWSEYPLRIGESCFASSFVAGGVCRTGANHSLPNSVNLLGWQFAELRLGCRHRPWRRLNVGKTSALASSSTRGSNLLQCRVNALLH